MKCYSCKGDMKRGSTTYTVNRNGYHLLIDDVSAWICDQCGEIFFEEEDVKMIQNMLKEIDCGAAMVRKRAMKLTL